MPGTYSKTCTAFSAETRLATGPRLAVATAVKEFVDDHPEAQVLVFDDETSRPLEFDLRGSVSDVRARMTVDASGASPSGEQEPPARRGPGRPKLGVVAKEVTLLPRHWAWLGSQRGGASATLRRLVEDARRDNEHLDHVRSAHDSTFRFTSAMAGNQPGFEEAMRALFAGDRDRFRELIAPWPPDLFEHTERISGGAFAPSDQTSEGAAADAGPD